MRTIEQIADDPQVGDVVMVPVTVEHVGDDGYVYANKEICAGLPARYWAELCRSATIPGDGDD